MRGPNKLTLALAALCVLLALCVLCGCGRGTKGKAEHDGGGEGVYTSLSQIEVINAYALGLGALSVLDIVGCMAATSAGIFLAWKCRKHPVIANAIIIPAHLSLIPQSADFYVIPFAEVSLDGSYALMYLFGIVAIGIGEAVVMYALGLPLSRVFKNTRIVQILTVHLRRRKSFGLCLQLVQATRRGWSA